ncbi:MAG: hypothetical protein IPK78_17975 [Rhodospirillales bacterium]|nr:hypothetical protein [Rhodospirillales bacterium]
MSGIGGGAAVLATALFLGKTVTEKIADGATKVVESRLRRIEDRNKTTFAFASAVDTDLRTRRIAVYAELWENTGLLPMWPWNTALEYRDLQQFTLDLRDWYFKRGGLFLSTGARDAYFAVQKSINAVLADHRTGAVAEADYGTIRENCSALRTELAEDILSRRNAPKVGSENG